MLVRQKELRKRRELTIDPELSADFSLEELNTALLTIKPGKAAGFDGVYPEFIKNSETKIKKWIVSLFNDILRTGIEYRNCLNKSNLKRSLNLEKTVKMLLSIVFKLLERLILQPIKPLIDEVVLVFQAGFGQHRSCIELKTVAVFIDLTAAFETVYRWVDAEIHPCAKLSKLLNNLLSNRFFQVFLGVVP
jgi:hypothetical protein